MADHDDPVVTPVAMLKTGLDNTGYRDPTEFRKIAIKVEEAGAPRQITFQKSTPMMNSKWSPILSDIRKSTRTNCSSLWSISTREPMFFKW
ncbi:unnamed protein product [Nesidiocoris tenuis]|uniref:Uncharacterized protein n=1 Tax=Nesidiocoris tenuis TaxID=355587 RepID=A0A6H5GRP5_9HEMI|nr:unnamed protein product [Nesidiocoris tenuis]